MYFHGHTVGGTNPSLLEAMGCRALIVANDNIFNKSVLGADAYYFQDQQQIAEIISENYDKNQQLDKISNNIYKINTLYNWSHIIDEYEKIFKQL